MDTDPLVRDYLGRLEAAAWPLTAERRSELIGEVREHIESALSEAGRRDEVTVRNVLERLGRPEEIVAAEAGSPALETAPSPMQPMAAALPRSPWGPVEVLALLLMTVGAVFLPIVGPLVGLVLVWTSPNWRTRDKAIATGIVLVLLVLPVVLLLGLTVDTGAARIVGGMP
jgi:uncharacterized membrane protein